MADMTGQELREITARLGWTAAELARRMGCSRQRVAALEQGDAPIPADLALALRGAAAWVDLYPIPRWQDKRRLPRPERHRVSA